MKRVLEQEIMEEMAQRYSSMYFGPGEVAEEDIEGMLLAATQAPSAYNEQPWRFFVAKTPQDKEMLMEYMMPGEKEWMAAALEAQRRGYVTHCIGSFDRVDLRNEFQQNENLELYGMVAVGRPAADEVTAKEKMMPRKSVNAVQLRRR